MTGNDPTFPLPQAEGRRWPPSKLPFVVNEDPEVCPECGRSDALASVYRDMGSEKYCNRCRTVRWPNPSHERGAAKLARLRRMGATVVGRPK